MQKADASRMGQKKHHQSSLRTTTLVTTRSRAAKLAARPDKTHGSIESENRLLPRTQPRPVAEDEIFALPFLHDLGVKPSSACYELRMLQRDRVQ